MKTIYGCSEIKIELNIRKKQKSFYTLILYKDIDGTVSKRKFLILSEGRKFIPIILEKYITDVRAVGKIIRYQSCVINVEKVINLVKHRSLDTTSEILNLINTLDDLRISLSTELEAKEQSLLDDFANHLTFRKRYGRYFKMNNVEREDIIFAIKKLVFVLMKNSKILTDKNIFLPFKVKFL